MNCMSNINERPRCTGRQEMGLGNSHPIGNQGKSFGFFLGSSFRLTTTFSPPSSARPTSNATPTAFPSPSLLPSALPPSFPRNSVLSTSNRTMDHSRDPCPWVIINDFGGAFSMGVSRHPVLPPGILSFCIDDIQAVGGAVWHGVKGFRNSPAVSSTTSWGARRHVGPAA